MDSAGACENCLVCSSSLKFKAEGLKNAVFEVNSTDNTTHKVIRVRKRRREGENVPQQDEARKLHRQEEIFYSHIMQKLISPKYCLPIQSIPLDTPGKVKLQTALEIASNRRAKRFVDLTELDHQFPLAFLMDDHTLCAPAFVHSSPEVFCVEIKPKSGCVTTSPLINPSHNIKRTTCSYCLRQMLKVAQGDVDKQSYYCPSDLFSGTPTRITRALNALLQNPQNNFKIFYKGSLCFTGKLGGKHKQMNIQRLVDLDELLSHTFFTLAGDDIKEHSKKPREMLVSMLCEIISKEQRLLDVIKATQSRDYFNIEAIYPFYNRLLELGLLEQLEEYCLTPQPNDLLPIDSDDYKIYYNLLALDVQELKKEINGPQGEGTLLRCFRVIKDFLFAASLKDCSIMITLVKHPERNYSGQLEEATWSILSVPGSGCDAGNICIYYRVAIIDVDPKPLRNIPKYAKMDNLITHNAMSAFSSGFRPCNHIK